MKAKFLLTAICCSQLLGSAALADIVKQTSHNIWMAWRDGSSITLGECDRFAPMFTRESCSTDIELIEADLLAREYFKYFSDKHLEAETRQIAAMLRIQQIDQKSIEFLSVSPDPVQRPDLLQKAERIRNDIADVTLLANDQSQQVRLIEAELVVRPSQDLADHLIVLRRQLAATLESKRILEKNLLDALKIYIEANSSLFDPAVFRGMQNQRKRAVYDLENAENTVTKSLGSSVDAARVWKMLEDGSFTYEHISRNYPATDSEVGILGDVMSRILRSQR